MCKNKKKTVFLLDKVLAIVALMFLIVAWFIGNSRVEAKLIPLLKQSLPEAAQIEPLDKGNFVAFRDNIKKQKIGYISTGSSYGYGGTLKLSVAVSIKGNIQGLSIISHKETPVFLQKILKSDFLRSLKGKSYLHLFELGKDIDGVSGATYTARAIAASVRKATRNVTRNVLNLDTPLEPSVKIIFGFIEIFIIFLFVVGYLGNRKTIKYRKHIRWFIMLASLFVIGFYFNNPLSLVQINKMLLGYLPPLQTHIYFYVLIIGLLAVLIFKNKNIYCERICPFGSAQECIGLIGGAKNRINKNVRHKLKWVQRIVALTVIFIALIYSHPGIYSFEVFGAFFHLIGSVPIFVLLGIVMLSSLFIKRFWCNFLCPINPVIDYLKLMRNWIKDIFKSFVKNNK